MTAKDWALPAATSIHLKELKLGTSVNSFASKQLEPSPRRPYSLRPITNTWPESSKAIVWCCPLLICLQTFPLNVFETCGWKWVIGSFKPKNGYLELLFKRITNFYTLFYSLIFYFNLPIW